MVEKHDRIWALYPEYFDSGITRHLGRKVRIELAQPSPTLDELFDSARKLDLRPVKESNIAYPAFWWNRNGRLLVRQEWSKSETIKRIAMEIAERRKIMGVPGQQNEAGKKDQSKKRDYHKGSKKAWKDRKKGKKGKKGKKDKGRR